MLTTPELAARLRMAVGRLSRRLRQESIGGLTPSQASILVTLTEDGPMNMSRLASQERISKPATTGIVGRLTEKGLVSREPDPSDARSTIIGSTKRGRELLEARRSVRIAFLARRIDLLDQEDREVLAHALLILESMSGDDE